MSELTQMLRFFPKTIQDESRIYRAKPIVMSDSSALIINDYGLSLCKVGYETMSLDIPEADEVILAREGIIYACWFGDGYFRVQKYRFEVESFQPDGEPCVVNIQDFDDEELVVLGVGSGIELWLDTANQSRRIWTIANGIARKDNAVVVSRPDGELLFSSGAMVAFAEDLGVRGSFLNVVDLASQKMWRVRSAFIFAAMGRVFSVADSDPTVGGQSHGLYVFKNEQLSFLEADGPVVEAGGNSDRVVISVFTGKDAQLREINEDQDCRLVVYPLDAPEGYKALSLDGSLCAVRGFTDVIAIAPTPSRQSQVLRTTHPSDIDSNPLSAGEYVVSRAAGETIGAVIHFHGGPESYEVPEGRFFGLPQWCNAHQLDWVGVNYQGSLMPDPSSTRSAWRRWRSALEEDFLGAIELTTGPIVLVGWSFGAAIALALGASSERVRGLLLGGTTGDLVKHVNHASTIDSEHYDWFEQRFDLVGDDASFFSGMNGFVKDLQVLEIHGVGDMNCPAHLSNEVADRWAERQNPWSRVWLPGGGHFALIPEDVELIVEASREFLTTVLLRAA